MPVALPEPPTAAALFLDATPHPVVVCAAPRRIVWHNAAAARLAAELRLSTVRELLPAHHSRLLGELQQDPVPVDVEVTVDGRTLAWTYTPLPGEEQVFLSAREMTRQHRTEAQLRLSEARHRLLAEQCTDLISRHTPQDWRFLYASPAVQPLLGYTPGEIIGRSSYELIHPDDADAYRRRAPSVAYHQGIYTNTYRIRCKDGRYTWLETTSRTLRDPATHEPLEIICVSRDVSRRMEAEQNQRRHQQDLAHAARLIALGEMATSLAHELNQPLAAIVNYARGCIRRMDAQPPASPLLVREGLERIATQAQRAAEIIKRLRGFVRKGGFQRVSTPIDQVLRAMIEFCELETRRQPLKIRFEPAPELPPVAIDRVQIEQVVLNLLRNAQEACQAQGNPDCVVTVRSELYDARVRVEISDQGPGLPPDREALFEQFYTTKPGGLGMGLAISRSIIEAHGGRLWAEDNPGGGACFRFTLPPAPIARPGRRSANPINDRNKHKEPP